jgi:hypothetical protein
LKIDLIIRSKAPFNDSQFGPIRRIKPGEDYEANSASPEDVISMKMIYLRKGGSDKHLRDVSGIMGISGAEVDETYITSWAAKLELMEIWDGSGNN